LGAASGCFADEVDSVFAGAFCREQGLVGALDE
jgi:hypothetical protein